MTRKPGLGSLGAEFWPCHTLLRDLGPLYDQGLPLFGIRESSCPALTVGASEPGAPAAWPGLGPGGAPTLRGTGG